MSLAAGWTVLPHKLRSYPTLHPKYNLLSKQPSFVFNVPKPAKLKKKATDFTVLGREQALLTGKRLQEFGYDFTHLIVSTMTRARETAGLIQESLPKNISLSYCSLLEEGAPIPPEPPVQGYSPKAHVRLPLSSFQL